MKCKSCGADNDADAGFCENCGGSLHAPACPKCGKENKSDRRFCIYCGQALEEQAAPVRARSGMPAWAWGLIGLSVLTLVLAATLLFVRPEGLSFLATPTSSRTAAPTRTLTPTPTRTPTPSQTPAPLYGTGTIVFDSDIDGDKEIYLMDLATGNTTQLTDNSYYDGAPSWFPDGQKILFVSNRDGDNEIFVMDADGTDQIQLTFNIADDNRPAVSPDGKWFAYESKESGNWDVYVYKTENNIRYTCTTDPATDVEAHFAPDKSLVFTSYRTGGGDLYTTTCYHPGEEKRLTDHAAFDAFGSYSPDGRQIVFHSKRNNDRLQLYLMGKDGSGVTQLSPNDAWDAAPVWSPDGGQIVFLCAGGYEICIQDLTTSQRIQVTSNKAGEQYPSFRP